MKISIKKLIKITVSVILGILITLLFYATAASEYYGSWNIYDTLIIIMYIAGIFFLILWNTAKTKLVFFLFLVPIICTPLGIGINKHEKYVGSLPRVSDELNLYSYRPFNAQNKLAVLNEKSSFKLNDDLPNLDGATAFYPLYAAFVQAIYPKREYDYWNYPVKCSRTAYAYEQLLAGNADIIFCLEPSETQLQQFIDKNINLKMVPIGKEAFVFFVNESNPVNNLTQDNIHGIYSGKIKNWKKLNGKSKNIRVFQRPKNSGSQTILEKIMGDIPIVKPLQEEINYGMGEMISEVAVYKNFNDALGYSFLIYTAEMIRNNQIKLLSINNVFPSAKTIKDGSYPYVVDFYAIYIDTADKNKNIEPFIEWILSEQGQTLVSKTGYVPIIDN